MFQLLLLAAAPLVRSAWGQDQKPLVDTTQNILRLTMNADRRFYFPSISSPNGERTLLDLSAISQLVNNLPSASHRKTASITIPMDLSEPVEMVLGASPDSSSEENFIWAQTRKPGRNIQISSAAVRRGGQISMDARTTHLALDTPFITLPEEIYDVVALATRPVQTSRTLEAGHDDVVDCVASSRFPDIVLSFEAESAEDKEGLFDEFVVTPEQYVLRTGKGTGGEFGGRCILLVQKGDEVGLGWAAARGRSLWLDFEGERTGLEI